MKLNKLFKTKMTKRNLGLLKNIEIVYLPTKKCFNINFLIDIWKIIKNSELKKSDIIRKDYATQTLFEYSKSFKFKKYKWLDYNTYIDL